MPRSNKTAVSLLFLLIALTSAVAQQDNPAASKTVIVNGTVTDSITGQPVVHAHVVLTGILSTNLFGAITNSDGGFSMGAVLPGTYSVAATHRLYLAHTGIESSPQVKVKAGDDLSALNIQLVPASVISGCIVDERNHPVPGALVEAFGPTIQRSAQSDDLGRFRIAGLSNSHYLVKARSNNSPLPPEIRTDGTVEVNYGASYYPNTLNPESAVQVQTQPGRETSDIVIKMKIAPIVRVSGMVVGAPPGPGNVSLGLQSNFSATPIQLDEMNRFTVWRVDRGTLRLAANTHGNNIGVATLQIDVNDNNIDNLVLPLHPRFEFQGNIARIPSFNRTGKDDPLGGYGKVILRSAEPMTGLSAGSYFDSAEIGAKGDFKFSNIVPGRYIVSVEGYSKNIYVRNVHFGPLKMENGVIDLRNGPPDQPLDVELGTDGGEITGTVLHSDNTPALAQVWLLRRDSDGYKLLQLSMAFKAPYTFTSVPPGIYLLLASEDVVNTNLNAAEFAALYRGLMTLAIVGSGDSVTRNLKLPGIHGSR